MALGVVLAGLSRSSRLIGCGGIGATQVDARPDLDLAGHRTLILVAPPSKGLSQGRYEGPVRP